VRVEEIDSFLEELAQEFDVPKPNYCVYKVICIKRLKPFSLGHAEIHLMGMRDYIPYGALFTWQGNLPYIVFLLKGTRGISRKSVIHEFIHYVHFLKRGCEAWKTKEEYEEEEKLTRREVNEYWRKLQDRLASNKKYPLFFPLKPVGASDAAGRRKHA